jgi:hypothetical protein
MLKQYRWFRDSMTNWVLMKKFLLKKFYKKLRLLIAVLLTKINNSSNNG